MLLEELRKANRTDMSAKARSLAEEATEHVIMFLPRLYTALMLTQKGSPGNVLPADKRSAAAVVRLLLSVSRRNHDHDASDSVCPTKAATAPPGAARDHILTVNRA